MRPLLVALALLLGAVGAARAELRLELRPLVAEPVLGEPVSVQAVLRNLGPGPERVPRELAPEFGFVRYRVTGPDGTVRDFDAWALKELADPLATLPPGGAVTATVELFFDGRRWIFDRPGAYRVDATYLDRVAAAPVTVTVSPPRSRIEQRAAELLLAAPEAGLFVLLRGGDHLTEGVRVLTEVADTAPGTPQGSYANLALGLSRAWPHADFVANRLRPADPAAAAARLAQVDTGRLGPGPTAEARLALAGALRALGRPEEALAVERELGPTLEQRFPDLAPAIREQILPEARRSAP